MQSKTAGKSGGTAEAASPPIRGFFGHVAADSVTPKPPVTWPEWTLFLVLALLLASVLLWPVPTGPGSHGQAVKAIASGIIVVLIAFLTLRPLFTRKTGLLSLILGDDNRPSTSKFQVVLWTAAVVFSYTAFRVVSLADGAGSLAYTFTIPSYLWIAMGFSTATAVGAKAITMAQTAERPGAKPVAAEGNETTGMRALVTDDSQHPEITKIQLVTWTGIAVTVFLGQVLYFVWNYQTPEDGAIKLPDIDQALLVLSGLAQGTYLGRKLIPDYVSTLSLLSPLRGKPGDEITITGNGFGPAQAGSVVTIDGAEIGAAVTAWTNTQIKLIVPGSEIFEAAGLPVPAPGRPATVGVITGGAGSANGKPFFFLPKVTAPSFPLTFPQGAPHTVRLTGDLLGTVIEVQVQDTATHGGVHKIQPPSAWITEGREFTFDLPSALPKGAYEIIVTAGTASDRIVCTDIIPLTLS